MRAFVADAYKRRVLAQQSCQIDLPRKILKAISKKGSSHLIDRAGADMATNRKLVSHISHFLPHHFPFRKFTYSTALILTLCLTARNICPPDCTF
jgi:hypothetical protein